jgi:hypothetical protein
MAISLELKEISLSCPCQQSIKQTVIIVKKMASIKSMINREESKIHVAVCRLLSVLESVTCMIVMLASGLSRSLPPYMYTPWEVCWI